MTDFKELYEEYKSKLLKDEQGFPVGVDFYDFVAYLKKQGYTDEELKEL